VSTLIPRAGLCRSTASAGSFRVPSARHGYHPASG
jgi:hypothetical protein